MVLKPAEMVIFSETTLKKPIVVFPQIEDIMKEYVLPEGTYKRVTQILLEEMEKGLGKDTNAKADIKMFPSYVRALPDGTETGDFLALDLGGTNFRVLLITLKGQEVEMKNKIYPIPEKIMVGKGTALFDHIVECIGNFMTEQKLHGQRLPLGFTFSFPCKQEGLDVGRLVQWTKGFNCEGVEGQDVVKLLHEAIGRKKDLDVECVAILNDTVGCLMSCAFVDHDCEIGVILGTGTNACYMEKLDPVELWDSDRNEPKQVIINTEWGAFGENGCLDFLRTDVDKAIDAKSPHPGKHLYEKMISGMYMGEICRQVLVKCAQANVMFGGVVTDELAKEGNFFTKYVSEIEADKEDGGYPNTLGILEELGYESNVEEARNVQYICECVSKRAAYLSSSGIACLLNRINKATITVAVDGSLYRYHPHFHNHMMQKIQQLLNPGLKFKLMLSEDGSGKGAALVAAVADRLRNEAQ